MLVAKARWLCRTPEAHIVDRLRNEGGLSPLVAKLLASRGVTEAVEAARWIKSDDQPADPGCMDGMETAVGRIRQAVENAEKIWIYGDYDADGVCSTALMAGLLDALGANYECYIPHRIREGYGMNQDAVRLAHANGVRLIITVDNGISAVEEIALAIELGMDVVVTDHHEPPPLLPEATVLVNPRKPGCPYPFKGLAGAGVALKVAQAMLPQVPEAFYQLAAIGTIADLMPLTGENRHIVRRGLEAMRTAALPGLAALCAVSAVNEREVSAGQIGFRLGPRLNAGGRIDTADEALRLLRARGKEEAAELAAKLDRLNQERQQLVEQTVEEAMELMAADEGEPGLVTVAAAPGWNVGIAGIVASRLVEARYRPALVLCIEEDGTRARGSGRSIAGFDLYGALRSCADLLEHFGGHQAAAGLTIRTERLGELRRRLCAYAEAHLSEEDLTPLLHVDGTCELSEANLEEALELAKLEPYGIGNPAPRFLFPQLQLKELRTMGKEGNHLKLIATDGNSREMEAVMFGEGRLSRHISATSRVDLVAELSLNEWNGVRRPQLRVRDLRVSHTQVFDMRGMRDPLGWLETAATEEIGAMLQPSHASKGKGSEIREISKSGERKQGKEKPDKISKRFGDVWNAKNGGNAGNGEKGENGQNDGNDGNARIGENVGNGENVRNSEDARNDDNAGKGENAGANAANAGLPVILIFSKDDLAALPSEERSRFQVLLIGDDPSGEWQLLSTGGSAGPLSGESLQPEDIRRAVLWGMPLSLAQLAGVLRRLSAAERIYVRFQGESETALPSRDGFKRVYGAMLERPAWNLADREALPYISRRTGLSEGMVTFILGVFEELAFVRMDGSLCRPVPKPPKRELSTSRRYLLRSGAEEVREALIYSTAREVTDWILQRLGSMTRT